MIPVKSQGSSRPKGKEIAINDPIAKVVGKGAPLSKSECFKDKEGSRNPDNECDAHAPFPVVLGDYLPPSPGCVWLSICRHDTKVSWAPLASSIPDLDIHQGTSLLVPILFEFELGTLLG